MRKQDYLVALIKALKDNERQFFKLFASIRPGEKEYLRLFDVLENKDYYNAGELSKELGFTDTQLIEHKRYLGTMIMRSLLNVWEQTSEIGIVFRTKDEAITLLGKRLFDYALELTDKALPEAWKLELFETIPEFLLIKHQCLWSLQRFDEMMAVTVENQKALNAMSEMFEMYELRARAMHLKLQVGKTDELNELLKRPVLKKKPEQLLSLKARIAWFAVMHYRYSILGDKANFIKNARAELAYYDSSADMKAINLVGYLSCYTRLAEAESEVGNYKQALAVLERQKAFLKPTRQVKQVRIDALTFLSQIAMVKQLRYLERFDEAYLLLQQMLLRIEQQPPAVQYDAKFNYAITLFALQKTEEAYVIADELLRVKEGAPADGLTSLRPFIIALELERGNYELIPYLVKSTKAWMQRNKLKEPEFDLFFKHSSAIAKSAISNRTTAWKALQKVVANGQLNNTAKELHLVKWLHKKA